MEENKEYVISNVSEYLDIIRENNLKEYIYRGQNEKYSGIQASGFRPYKGGFDNDRFYDMKTMYKEYSNKIISSISEDERKHFVAFCQHHGLPTNLVDFTYSPLVALFFACEGKKNTDKNAEVYLINKNRLVDITEIIVGIGYNNLLEFIMYDDSELRVDIMNKITDCFSKDIDSMYNQLITLMKSYEYYGLNVSGSKNEDYDEDEETNDYEVNNEVDISIYIKRFEECESNLLSGKEQVLNDLYYFLLEHITDKMIIHKEMSNRNCYFDKEIKCADIFLALLINLLQLYDREKNHFNINSDLLFTYQPPNIFNRISSQKGLFIYQSYISYKCPTYDYQYLCKQTINPNITIGVINTDNILEELDLLGINLESIYGDYDNIAKYIKSKYDKKLI